jgi:nucleoside-diphosphate-sugar epimerase
MRTQFPRGDLAGSLQLYPPKESTMTQPTVLILGANGRLGAEAVRAFANAGWRVLAQARRGASTLPEGVRAIHIPLEDIDQLAQAATGANTVVYAINPLYTDWEAQMLPLARLGMDLAQRLDANFMLPGNIYNYGETMPNLLTEQTLMRPSSRKGQLRCHLEAEMRERAAKGLRSVVLRAGDFYGSGSGSWLDQLIVKDIGRGKLAYPGPVDVPHAWAYLPDLARAFVALALRPALLGKSVVSGAEHVSGSFESFGFAGHTFTGRELLANLEDVGQDLALRPATGFRTGGMPWGLIRTIGLVYPLWRELARMSYLWRVPHRLSGSSLERAVGPLTITEPKTALRDALLALGLGHFREQGNDSA